MNKDPSCKYCKYSKVSVGYFLSYSYWIEYHCKYKDFNTAECKYSKMNILEKIIRFIKVAWLSIV